MTLTRKDILASLPVEVVEYAKASNYLYSTQSPDTLAFERRGAALRFASAFDTLLNAGYSPNGSMVDKAMVALGGSYG